MCADKTKNRPFGTIGHSMGTLNNIISVSEVIQNIPIRDKYTNAISILPKYRYAIAKVLHGSVDISDRRHHFKTFKNCFVAASAIDVCVDLFQIARYEAVQLIQFIADEGFIAHVSKDIAFSDDDLFFKFTPSFYHHIKRRNSVSSNITPISLENGASDRESKRQFSFTGPGGGLTRVDTSLAGNFASSPRSSIDSSKDNRSTTLSDLMDRNSSRRSSKSSYPRSSMDSSSSGLSQSSSQSPNRLVATGTISFPGLSGSATATGISEGNRSKISITEFLGDHQVNRETTSSRDTLKTDQGISSTNPKLPPQYPSSSPETSSAGNNDESNTQYDDSLHHHDSDESTNDTSMQVLRTHSSRGPITHGSFLSLGDILSESASADLIQSQIDLDQRLFLPDPKELAIKSKTGRISLDAETARSAALLLFTHVDIDDRRYLLKIYNSVFIGTDATSVLVSLFNVTRAEAVQIGIHLMQEDLIHHCTYEHSFADANYFYAFSETFYFIFNIPMPHGISGGNEKQQTVGSKIAAKSKKKKSIWEICSAGQISKLTQLFSRNRSDSISSNINPLDDVSLDSLRYYSSDSKSFRNRTIGRGSISTIGSLSTLGKGRSATSISPSSSQTGLESVGNPVSNSSSSSILNSETSQRHEDMSALNSSAGDSTSSDSSSIPLPPMQNFGQPSHPQINALNHEGYTPLLCAVMSSSEECVSLLCRQWDINVSIPSAKTGLNPLMTACQLGNKTIVDLLLSAGANPLTKSLHDGSTCLHWASWHGHSDIIILLGAFILDLSVDDISKATSLQIQTQLDSEQLLLFHSYLDTQSKSGSTALHWAASQGFMKSVCLLLDWGANPLLENSHNETPCKVASRRGFTNISSRIAEAETIRRKQIQEEYVSAQVARLKDITITEWNSSDVAFFVEHLGFPSISSTFQSNQIDGGQFFELTKSDLLELGFNSFSYRATFIRAVQEYFPEFCCSDAILLGRQMQKLQAQLEDMRNQMTILNERVRILMENNT